MSAATLLGANIVILSEPKAPVRLQGGGKFCRSFLGEKCTDGPRERIFFGKIQIYILVAWYQRSV